MNNNDFFSLDKLVEFGLGLGIAQQMIAMMNQGMQSMYVPGSYMALNSPAQNPDNIYVAENGKPVGPLSSLQFLELVNQKKVNKDTLAWIPGKQEWQKVEQLPELLKIIALSPPPLPKS